MKRLLCLLPLMACGDDGGSPADAPSDTQVTADAPVDAPASTVTLTIRADGTGVPDVDVFFQHPDGSLAAKVATNASGVASAVVGAGGWVTVVDPFEGVNSPQPTGIRFNDVRTYAGVKPGDQLLMESGSPAPTDIDVTFTLPVNNNATIVEVSTSCGGSFITGTTDTITLSDCGTMADVVAVAYDANDAPIGYFYKADVAVADQGTVNLSAETYAAVPDANFTYTNMPSSFVGAAVDNGLRSPRGSIYSTDASATFTAGAGSVTTPRPLPTPTTSVLELEPELAAPGMSQFALFTWQPAAATHAVDGTNKFLPAFTAAPTYAAATRQVAWTSTGTVQPDFMLLSFSAIRETPNLLGWEWTIIAPYTATNVTLPALPTDIAQFVPNATDLFEVDQLFAAKLPGGYDAIRPSFFASNSEPPITGATGEISIVMYDAPQVVVRTAPSSWRKLFAGTHAVNAKADARAQVKAAVKAKAAAAKATKRARVTR